RRLGPPSPPRASPAPPPPPRRSPAGPRARSRRGPGTRSPRRLALSDLRVSAPPGTEISADHNFPEGASMRLGLRLAGLAPVAAVLVCMPAPATAQAPAMFSNLANPAIGMNALISGQAAHNLDQPYGLQFDEAEISLISVVDPYWTLTSNIVFTPDGVDPEEVWVRNTSIPSLQLKLGKLRGTFG